MNPQVFDRLGLLLFFAIIIVCIFLAWYFQHKARTRERMALIEKGVDVEELSIYNKPSKSALKIFIILMGLATVFGIYTIFLMMDRKLRMQNPPKSAQELLESVKTEPILHPTSTNIVDTAYPFVFFFCMGIAFLIIHLIDRKEKKNG